MGFRFANIEGRAALVAGDQYFDVAEISGGERSSNPMEALADPVGLTELSATLDTVEPSGEMTDALVGPPVPRPQKCFAIGLNYQAHADEGPIEAPEVPLVFTKFPSCLVGPKANVELRSGYCDYEVELVVVIGTGGKDIAKSDAWDHVLGVTIGQDISDRKAQFAAKPPHWALGKSFDTFGPTGPVLVTVDELADRDALRLVTKINGEVRQQDTTANLIFDVPTLIAYLSRVTTLVPGDLIFTGTPEGVGAATRTFLNEGDIITSEIEGIGVMENTCVRVSDHQMASMVATAEAAEVKG